MRKWIARFKYWLDYGDGLPPLYLTGMSCKDRLINV